MTLSTCHGQARPPLDLRSDASCADEHGASEEPVPLGGWVTNSESWASVGQPSPPWTAMWLVLWPLHPGCRGTTDGICVPGRGGVWLCSPGCVFPKALSQGSGLTGKVQAWHKGEGGMARARWEGRGVVGVWCEV